jgi:precorrin-6A synthase
MRKVLIVGIGAGDPDHITIQAINALNTVDVFFVTDKGLPDLVRLRKDICERYVKNATYRTIEIQDPKRDRSTPSYNDGVTAWHEERAAIYERLIADELGDDECGAFLVWGDPSLYDSTLRIIDRIVEAGTVAFAYEVIPGISSIQALAAKHRVALNRIGGAVQITTGRRIATGLPEDADDVVVMLDGEYAFKHVDDRGIDIYWGAYIGTPDEILVSGRLHECAADIERIRREAKDRKGWIMDTYLLRRTAQT